MKAQLESIGFVVTTEVQPALNKAFKSRYGNLPEAYLHFLANLGSCVMHDDKAWFNTIADFNGTAESGFRWNEFEQLSLESAGEELNNEIGERENGSIIRFWNGHLPFLLSCRNGYSYFAICLLEEHSGEIVFGTGPEFESVEIVAPNFIDFMERLKTQTLNKKFLAAIL